MQIKRKLEGDTTLILGVLRPKEWHGTAISDELDVLSEMLEAEAPREHYLVSLRINCDAIREGYPKGRRLHFVAAYRPLPPLRDEMPAAGTLS